MERVGSYQTFALSRTVSPRKAFKKTFYMTVRAVLTILKLIIRVLFADDVYFAHIVCVMYILLYKYLYNFIHTLLLYLAVIQFCMELCRRSN